MVLVVIQIHEGYADANSGRGMKESVSITGGGLLLGSFVKGGLVVDVKLLLIALVVVDVAVVVEVVIVVEDGTSDISVNWDEAAKEERLVLGERVLGILSTKFTYRSVLLNGNVGFNFLGGLDGDGGAEGDEEEEATASTFGAGDRLELALNGFLTAVIEEPMLEFRRFALLSNFQSGLGGAWAIGCVLQS
jgi:hypothetical protein